MNESNAKPGNADKPEPGSSDSDSGSGSFHDDLTVPSGPESDKALPSDVTRALGDAPPGEVSQPSDAIFGAQGAGPPEAVGEVLRIGRYALIGSPAPPSAPGQSGSTHRKPYVDGGEGRLYLAQPLDGGTPCVLKTPLPQYANHPVRCARLIREAEQLQSLDHPSIVKVFDIDADHDPPYYTMTHLGGGSLADRIRKGNPMGTAGVLDLAIPLADAVRYVHDEKGISHRDIKPHNVMIDAQGKPVFVDFGLSRDNTGDEKTFSDPNASGKTNRFKVGTAMYMAPELFDGKAGNAQTDIYAFGVMLYEMATGKRPYEAPDFSAMEKKKRLMDCIPPAQAHPEIDDGLARVIEHALARRAKDRYATMEDLLEDLELLRAGRPPLHAGAAAGGNGPAAVGAAGGGSAAAPRGNRAVVAAAVVAVVLLLGGVATGVGYVVTRDGETHNANTAPVAEHNAAALLGAGGSDPGPGDADATPTPHEEPNTPQDNANTPDGPGDNSGDNTGAVRDVPADDPPQESQPGENQPGAGWADAATPDEAADQPEGGIQGGGDTQHTQEAMQDDEPGGEGGPTGDEEETTPPVAPHPALAMIERVAAELSDTDADPAGRDPEIAAMLGDLADLLDPEEDEAAAPDAHQPQLPALDAQAQAQLRTAYGHWLHRAASLGMPKTLALLINRADAFGASPGARSTEGETWLQTAVRSPETEGFALRFEQWLAANDIDLRILNQAAAGTRRPLALAQFHERALWVDVLGRLLAEPEE